MSVSSTSSSTDDSALMRAANAEREASKRIQAAGEQVKEAQKQASEQIDRVHDSYESQIGAQAARQENALESQQIKGYEQIRDLQRSQQANLRKTRRDGEKDLTRLEEHYRQSLFKTGQNSDQQLRDIQSQHHRQLEYEHAMNEAETTDLKRQYEQEQKRIRDNSEYQIQRLQETARREYEKMRAQSEESSQREQKQFDEKFTHLVTENSGTLNRIQSNASRQITDIREDTAARLSAYSDRQRDPFYKMMNLNARFYDNGDEFVLIASVPEYEQQHISASIKGNNLMISGNRRNEETMTHKDGHSVGSASFQSFQESFPLSWPVDSPRLSKEFFGDMVIVRVPKKNEYAFRVPEPKKPEKLRAEPPHFPENISQTEVKKKEDEKAAQDEKHNYQRFPGSGPLT